jgi:hypothetical protein
MRKISFTSPHNYPLVFHPEENIAGRRITKKEISIMTKNYFLPLSLYLCGPEAFQVHLRASISPTMTQQKQESLQMGILCLLLRVRKIFLS